MQEPHEPNSLCPIVPKIDPSDVLHNPDTINYILSDKSFHTSVRKKLLNAVKSQQKYLMEWKILNP